jgi:NADPH:quinone reductase
LQGLTAVTFTEDAYDVKKGDVILVHTIAGGLGLLFAQVGFPKAGSPHFAS